MPGMPPRIPARGADCGGVIGYPLDQLHREVAFVAYHFHWPHDQVMTLEHADRRGWVAEISAINQQINQE